MGTMDRTSNMIYCSLRTDRHGLEQTLLSRAIKCVVNAADDDMNSRDEIAK